MSLRLSGSDAHAQSVRYGSEEKKVGSMSPSVLRAADAGPVTAINVAISYNKNKRKIQINLVRINVRESPRSLVYDQRWDDSLQVCRCRHYYYNYDIGYL